MSAETKGTLLVVEDDPGLQSQLKWCVEGCKVVVAADRATALAHVRRYEPQVITLDMGLPPDPGGTSEGLAALAEILALAPATKVIVVTGNDDRASAVRAIGLGAYDFYLKPVEAEILRLIIDRAFRVHELELENRRLLSAQTSSPLKGVIAASPAMLKVCRTIEKVAPTDATTLLLGESGTGKELLARALHRLSPRTDKSFVAINCAAIPENLLESELFGYEKGAFTGAVKQTLGKIELAHRGTLFLDEVGDLPMALQAKLLRFLQERVIERVGGREEIPVDVRVISATHRDLRARIAEGSFREDLYYRLSEITVTIPSLRERDGDTVLLARAFLSEYAAELKSKARGFTPEALQAIEAYHWPGNVRELENRVKRAVIMTEDSRITAEDLEIAAPDQADDSFNLREVRDEAERRVVRRALSFENGNVSRAAERLGVSRPTLYELMKKYDLKA